MSAVIATASIDHHQTPSSTDGYKSLLRPSKFLHKNAKVDHHSPYDHKPMVQVEITPPSRNNKTFTLMMPSMPTMKKSSHQQKDTTILREAPKSEIYKLSTINDSGVYLPPSPMQESKRDHWLELDEDELAFPFPGPECLTTSGSPNKEQQSVFYTPSVIIDLAKLDNTSEDDIPSLMIDLSSAKATSVF